MPNVEGAGANEKMIRGRNNKTWGGVPRLACISSSSRINFEADDWQNWVMVGTILECITDLASFLHTLNISRMHMCHSNCLVVEARLLHSTYYGKRTSWRASWLTCIEVRWSSKPDFSARLCSGRNIRSRPKSRVNISRYWSHCALQCTKKTNQKSTSVNKLSWASSKITRERQGRWKP